MLVDLASGDNVTAGAFKAQAGVGAYIKDFPFETEILVLPVSRIQLMMLTRRY